MSSLFEEFIAASGSEALNKGISDMASTTITDDFCSSVSPGDKVVGPARRQRKEQQLVGREKEHKTLCNAWERVLFGDGASPEIVAVRGESGAGKSFLVEHFRPVVEREQKTVAPGFFVSSKFDQVAFKRCCREPFYAVVSALSDLCEILFAMVNAAEIREELKESIGVDFTLLAQFIPTLGSSTKTFELQQENFRKDGTLPRLCWACVKLLQVAAKHRPLVVHFDDVQWSDGDSLILMRALMTDTQAGSVLLIFSYRDDHESCEASSRLDLPCDCCGTIVGLTSFPRDWVTDIRLKCLDEGSVQTLVATILDSDESESLHELANVIFEKTAGNPFFVYQFLALLDTENLLSYSREDKRWVWSDLGAIARHDVSEDVLASIDAQVNSVHADVRYLLVVAAHIGFSFRKDVLASLVVAEYHRVYEDEELKVSQERFELSLEAATKASLLLPLDNGEAFCFMHDRVQQCAYEMVPMSLKSRFCLNMSRLLMPMVNEDETLTFLVADLLNNATELIIDDKDDTQDLVLINKRASELSMGRAAYGSATHYLRSAIELQVTDSWIGDYDLTLELHNRLAMASCNASDYVLCSQTALVIRENAHCVRDKQTAYLAHIHALTLESKYDDAVQVGFEALSELGSKLKQKPSPLALGSRMLRTRWALLGKSRSELMSLPKMEDWKKAAQLELLEELASAIFVQQDKALILQQYEAMMSYSLRYGWSPSTMTAIVGFGMVEFAAFRNVQRSSELTDLALDMVKRYKATHSECLVILVAYSIILPWTQSWKSCSENILEGYSSGIENGKTFFALSCLSMSTSHLRFSECLTDVDKRMRNTLDKMKRFKVATSVQALVRSNWQQVLNLMGCCEDVLKLTGEAMNEDELLPKVSPVSSTTLKMVKFELACQFKALDRAQQLMEEIEKEKDRQALICQSIVPYHLWAGLTRLDLARQGRRRRTNLRLAKSNRNYLAKALQNGCNDVRPFFCILDAEITSTKARRAQLQLYDLAIEVALEHGFLGYAGVACERAYFALQQQNLQDDSISQRYWDRMIALNTAWCARAKVEWLTSSYGYLHNLDRRRRVPEIVVQQQKTQSSKGTSETTSRND